MPIESNVSLSELSQEIDLRDYLNRKPSAEEKAAFAEEAINVINSRTLDGNDLNGNKFEKYSKDYAKAKGVSRSAVDLFLEGDMLDNIGRRTSKENAGTVFIQMKKGKQTKKGFNHHTGDTLPQREFFGITESEAESIAVQIKDDSIGAAKLAKAVASSKSSAKTVRESISLLDLEQII